MHKIHINLYQDNCENWKNPRLSSQSGSEVRLRLFKGCRLTLRVKLQDWMKDNVIGVHTQDTAVCNLNNDPGYAGPEINLCVCLLLL